MSNINIDIKIIENKKNENSTKTMEFGSSHLMKIEILSEDKDGNPVKSFINLPYYKEYHNNMEIIK